MHVSNLLLVEHTNHMRKTSIGLMIFIIPSVAWTPELIFIVDISFTLDFILALIA